MNHFFFVVLLPFGIIPLLVDSAVATLDRQVTVTGSCTRMVVPDRASITVTSEVKDLDPKKAMSRATENYERVREKVLRLKIEGREVSTSEVTLNELREWEKTKLVSHGFVARMGLRVESSEAGSLGEVSRVATVEGMKEIGSLTTFISSAKSRAETEVCLKDAVKSAQRKATEMADAAGARVGEVLTMSEQSSFQTPPMMTMRGAAMMQDSAGPESRAPTIEPGKQEIQTQVTVTFGLK